MFLTMGRDQIDEPDVSVMVTLATSARMTSNSSQPDLFELSTETGQDQTGLSDPH
jgi:hypothetical protein